jgi:hypothetical protein
LTTLFQENPNSESSLFRGKIKGNQGDFSSIKISGKDGEPPCRKAGNDSKPRLVDTGFVDNGPGFVDNIISRKNVLAFWPSGLPTVLCG